MKFCRNQLKNDAIEKRLVAAENIPIMEYLLDRNIRQHKKLENLKNNNKTNFLKKIESDKLEELALRIYGKVNKFLDFKPCTLPNIVHYRPNGFEYHSDLKLISVGTLQRTILIPSIAHEYAHHMQHSKRLGQNCYDFFSEGHARGVERHISEIYCQKEDNELFLYDISRETISELASAYIWMCKKLCKKPKLSLLKVSTNSIKESLKHLVKEAPSEYAMGNAFFSIYESIYGKEIYKEALIPSKQPY